LAARPSRDLVTAANQEISREWWEERRSGFELFVSEFVVEEASDENEEEAAKRIEFLSGIPLLAVVDEATALARELVSGVSLPGKAIVDALHIAIAAIHGIDLLLT